MKLNSIFLSNCDIKLAKLITFKVNKHDSFIISKIINNNEKPDFKVNNEYFEKYFILHFVNSDEFIENQLNYIQNLYQFTNHKVLIISNEFSECLINHTFNNGFIGCIELHYFLTNTMFVLESLIRTNVFFTSPMFDNLYLNSQKAKSNVKLNLTNQQSKVAKMLKEGKTYLEISKELNLSINTIRMHIRLMYKKLNIKNKAQLIAIISNNSI